MIIGMGVLFPDRSSAQALVEFADQQHDIIQYHGIRSDLQGNWRIWGYRNDEGGTGSGGFYYVVNNEGDSLDYGYAGYQGMLDILPIGLTYEAIVEFCDLIPHHTRLIGRLANGEQLFGVNLLPPSGSGVFHAQCMAQGSIDKIALVAHDLVIITSLNGDVIASWQPPANDILQAVWTSQDSLVLKGDSTIYKAHALTGEHSVYQANEPIKDLLLHGDSILCLTTHQVRVLSSSLVEVTATVISASDTMVEFMERGDQLFVRHLNGVIRLSSELQPQGGFTFSLLPTQVITDAVMKDNTVFTVGYVTHDLRSTGLLREYDLDGYTSVHAIDVEAGCTIDSIWRSWSPAMDIFSADMTITLVNHGSEHVDEIDLHYRIGPSITCGIEGTSRSYGGLNLAPGASVSVPFNDIRLSRYEWYPPETGAWIVEVCVLAQSPDQLVDRNMADNYACAEVELEELVTTALPAEGSLMEFSAIPNPARHFVGLTGLPPGTSGTIHLSDMLGRVLPARSTTTTDQGMVDLSLAGLAPGRYWVTFTTPARNWRTSLLLIE